MGVDCTINLPSNVRLQKVAEVVAIAAGMEPIKQPLNSKAHPDAWYVSVPGLIVRSSCVVTCADIIFQHNGEQHYVMYHFEPGDESRGGRLLMPRSTPFWICVAKRLIDLFGGWVDYQDCDSSYRDYERPPKNDASNCPSDGVHWQKLQERIFSVQPVTEEELTANQKFAAY
jgi:hypothetical protein